MKRLALVLAVVLTGCGGGTTTVVLTASTPVTTKKPPHTTPTTTPTTPNPPAGGGAPKPSNCNYAAPTSPFCEKVPPAGTCHFRVRADGNVPLPDRVCTPGATNPVVTASTVKSTICVSGYTSTIRPPVAYTNPLKLKLMAAYGVGNQSPANYELDHLIPLEGGGAAADPANLWPQAYAAPGAHQKDSEENFLKSEACGGKASMLLGLQAALAFDWYAAYQADNPAPAKFGAPQ